MWSEILHTAGQPPELPPKRGGMWSYPWTQVRTPFHLGHLDRLAATLPSQAPAGVASEAPELGKREGQDVPLVKPSSCIVKGGIPSSRRYLPTYLSPQGVLLPRVYGTMDSPLWLELQGPASRLRCPSESGPGEVARCALSLCRPRCVCVCAVLGHLAPVHRCTCPFCVERGVRGHLVLVHRCVRCVRYVCVAGGLVGDPPFCSVVSLPVFVCFSVLLFWALVLLCLLCMICFMIPRVCLSLFVVFLF